MNLDSDDSTTSIVITRAERKADDGTSEIPWVEVIFLPFHDVFKFITMVTAIIKCYLGPLNSVYSQITCQNIQLVWYLDYPLDYYKLFIGDAIYIVDTFLHILHRQVEDESRKREHVPKSALLVTLDIVSVIPLFNIAKEATCHPAQLWPNVLAFNEMLVIYRVFQYFSLDVTHSIRKLATGYIILAILVVNGITCFFLLMTYDGLCRRCSTEEYDWRWQFSRRYKQFKNSSALQYLHGFQYVTGFVLRQIPDKLAPKTLINLYFTCGLMAFGYYVWTFILVPKFVSETLMRLKHIYKFNVRVKKIVGETEQRSSLPTAHLDVEKYYATLWNKLKGIAELPDVTTSLPRHLNLSIKQDLVWAVFHHSPMFRKTSVPYKRYLCEHIHLEYKLAGERFFSGTHCYTHFYYIKSGIVQFFSSDDALSPLLSVSSGTLFGDVSFIIPPYNRKVILRCLTYCEVFTVSRQSMLMSLHKFPDDRHKIMKLVKSKLKHARNLYSCKENYRGQDTVIDQGFAWIKLRWWNISDTIAYCKRTKRQKMCVLPEEETNYHCMKYLGQLVLCTQSQLHRRSMFVSDKFPWLLKPHCLFSQIWNSVVYAAVWLAVLLIPPNAVRLARTHPIWFNFTLNCIDTIFVVDVIISLFTAIEDHDNFTMSLSAVATYRFKHNIYFILDILATPWCDKLFKIIGNIYLDILLLFNRLLKSYMLFVDRIPVRWNRKNNPERRVLYIITICYALLIYAGCYFTFPLTKLFPELSTKYMFYYHCIAFNYSTLFCNYANESGGVLSVLVTYFLNNWYYGGFSTTVKTAIATSVKLGFLLIKYIIFLFTRTFYLACIFYKYEEMIEYQNFVHRVQYHYKLQNIRPDLSRRLNNFINLHWNYYKGSSVLRSTRLHNESYKIYLKYHGEIAEQMISQADLLRGVDRGIVRELAEKTNYQLLPKGAPLIVFGLDVHRVNFIIKGHIKCEYLSDDGELITVDVEPGKILAINPIIFGGPSIRTYTAATDCEIIFFYRADFFAILKRYPNENTIFQSCIKELQRLYLDIIQTYILQYKEYHIYLRAKAFHVEEIQETPIVLKPSVADIKRSVLKEHRIVHFFKKYRRDPESRFIRYWMTYRVMVFLVSFFYGCLQSAFVVQQSYYLKFYFFTTSLFDMIFKSFLPFYDSRGLVISAKKQCFGRYLTRAFLIDAIATFPFYLFFLNFINEHNNFHYLVRLSTKFLHVYILFGWFDYYADCPSAHIAWIHVVKWQIVLILLTFLAAVYLVGRCFFIETGSFKSFFTETESSALVTMGDHCWVPAYVRMNKKNVTNVQLVNLYSYAINLTQQLLTQISSYSWRLHINPNYLPLYMGIYIVLGCIFWWISCHCQALLVLNYRSNTSFRNQVRQLENFLLFERVGKNLISSVMEYYNYLFRRTSGLDLEALMGERIGAVFRQDATHYFYERTLKTTAALLGGDVFLERRLATHVVQVYYLPQQDIVREMDLSPNVYIVNRGKVEITKEGKTLAILTQGSLFGQLDGSKLRPSRCTARSLEHTDLLFMTVKKLHHYLKKSNRIRIAKSDEAPYGYISADLFYFEDGAEGPVNYAMQEKKTIMFPGMRHRTTNESKWYNWWLIFSWFVAPSLTVVFVFLNGVVYEPPNSKYRDTDAENIVFYTLIALECIYVIYMITDLLTVELVKEDGAKWVYKYCWLKKIRNLWLYADILSLVITFGSFFIEIPYLHLICRLIRVRWFYDFYNHYCVSTKAIYLPILFKYTLLFLFLHSSTCSWIHLICRRGDLSSPPIPYSMSKGYDPELYVNVSVRQGCGRITFGYSFLGLYTRGFLSSINWQIDYVQVTTAIIAIFTKSNLDVTLPETNGVHAKVLIEMLSYLFELFVSSVVTIMFLDKVQEACDYEAKIQSLLKYLKLHGLSKLLLHSIEKYTTQVEQRQKDKFLPVKIINMAPLCLREDIMSALYIHHLKTPMLFEKMPHYFLRQLATRLATIVVYPGKSIVLEGDIYPCMFFIHEGEVERWYTDERGESRMSSLLTINNYFGVIPGLFPNTPYQFSYYARSVVDLVYLTFDSWQDLLNGYPEIKINLYRNALRFKKDVN